MGSTSLADVRRLGAQEAARQVLRAIPASSSLLLHFDIDVLQKREMPAAYFPHAEGMRLSEAVEALRVFLKDPRIRIIEISEYASLRDIDRDYVNKLVDMFTEGMKG